MQEFDLIEAVIAGASDTVAYDTAANAGRAAIQAARVANDCLQAGLLEVAATTAATASATAETASACLRQDKNIAFNASSNALSQAQVSTSVS